jgi:hypothetical protein
MNHFNLFPFVPSIYSGQALSSSKDSEGFFNNLLAVKGHALAPGGSVALFSWELTASMHSGATGLTSTVAP